MSSPFLSFPPHFALLLPSSFCSTLSTAGRHACHYPTAPPDLRYCTSPGKPDSSASADALLSMWILQALDNTQEHLTLVSERVLIGQGIPTIQKSLLQKICRLEYVHLAELLPAPSFADSCYTHSLSFQGARSCVLKNNCRLGAGVRCLRCGPSV